MLCRKDQATLTPDEKSRFLNALLALKANGKYDQYVAIHVNNMSSAHRAPVFFPWHREYLRRFELDLQAIDNTVTLPYWDWTKDNSPSSSLWSADFMGGNGRPSDGRVITGAFAYATGNWDLQYDGPALRRRLAQGVSSLPSATDVTTAIAVTPYDAAPYDAAPTTLGFRNRAEGWFNGPQLHNRVHVWVGGSMNPSSSANDPVFFLHHCFIDKMWADWQAAHPGLGYIPVAGLGNGMAPWNVAGDLATPGGLLDHHALGYAYDTENICQPKLKFLDDPITLKFVDDTLKQLDDPITLKFRDDNNTLKQLDDPITLKFRDDNNTFKQLDDPITIKFSDDGQTDPRIDPIKDARLDTNPLIDNIKEPLSDQIPFDPNNTIREGIPFVLSTPHHSMAWTQQLNPQQPSPQVDIAQLEAAIQNHESAIDEINQRSAQGRLTASEQAQAQEIFNSYQTLVAEYRRLKS